MSKSMENKTAAIYLRKSTEDDGKSVAVRSRTDETITAGTIQPEPRVSSYWDFDDED